MNTSHMFVAANWKAHQAPAGWDAHPSAYASTDQVDVVVFPMDQDILACADRGLIVGAQWGRNDGHTMEYYKERGCTYVLCGHSDRRINEGETDQDVADQVQEAANAGLIPIVCVGETADAREQGVHRDVVRRQIDGIVEASRRDASTASNDYFRRFILAYEPVWAIGTGNVASPDDVQAMHSFIHSLLPSTMLLYGGSVQPENAPNLVGVDHVDGFLVGGASLDPEKFRKIIAIAKK